ncbi:MAG: hypothetical protein NT041_01130 [Candidatus Vogelbacteria bacterium]|nr:hypothetical protein [Candidatus Vogelbacteria bacterium]
MNFIFKAKKSTGEEVSGQRDSADRFSLARELRAEGLIAFSVEEVGQKHGRSGEKKSWRQLNISFNRVKMKDKIIFAVNN